MHFEANKALVTDAEVLIIILQAVLSLVPTVIVTTTNLETKVSHKGAEAVVDAEEDQEQELNSLETRCNKE
jgi:hypothetical protein